MHSLKIPSLAFHDDGYNYESKQQAAQYILLFITSMQTYANKQFQM